MLRIEADTLISPHPLFINLLKAVVKHKNR